MSEAMMLDFVRVRSALAQRVADAKFLAKGRGNRRESEDSDDLQRADEAVDGVPTVYHLTYEDRDGFMSERVVTIRRIERRAASLYIHGHCHLAEAPRCFAVERIQEVFDAATGEVAVDPRDFFGSHSLYHSPRDPLGVAVRTCQHEINLLTVVGAADGLFDPDEQDVLLVHIANRCDHLQLDETAMRSALALMAPDFPAFRQSLFQMRQFKAGDSRALLRSLRKIVDADGRLAPEEVVFVQEIERALAPMEGTGEPR